VMSLTNRQRREINMAVRHLGRAMAAMVRANVPQAQGMVSWQHRINDGEASLCQASDELIEGLEMEADGAQPAAGPARCSADGCGRTATRECQHDEWIAICGRALCDEHDCAAHPKRGS